MVEQWGRGSGWRREREEEGNEEDVKRARAETREGQFDVNRSIVIRVNRLPLSPTAPDGLPNTIRDLYCSTLFPEWSSHHRDGLRVSMLARYKELGWSSSEETRLIYLDMRRVNSAVRLSYLITAQQQCWIKENIIYNTVKQINYYSLITNQNYSIKCQRI